MPFLRKKKVSKSAAASENNEPSNETPLQINATDSSSTREGKGKFGRKKKTKSNVNDTTVTADSHEQEAPITQPLIESFKPLSMPQPSRNNASKISSQTVTTTSSTQSSSISDLFDHDKTKKTNALQKRQLSHMQRVNSIKNGGTSSPGNNGTVSPGSGAGLSRDSSSNIQSQASQTLHQPKQPQSQAQTDLFDMPTAHASAMPIARGWSMVSAASTAMNSVQYIESLDNLSGASPGGSSRGGKQFPILNSQPNNRIRSSLSRPFGRSHFPASYQPKWEVSIDPPIYDTDESRYKYKIHLVRCPSSSSRRDDGLRQLTAYNSATTTRSLQDFVWLERALRAEYHGAMLVPLLSLALYLYNEVGDDNASTGSTVISEGSRNIPPDGNITSISFGYLEDKMDRNELVDNTVLANWLYDIFNNVRGNGELILMGRGDVSESEAVETFLFRRSELLKEPSRMGNRLGVDPCRASGLGSPFNLFSIFGDRDDGDIKCMFDNFLDSPFTCFGSENDGDRGRPRQKLGFTEMCSSGGTGIKGCNDNLSVGSIEDDFAGFQMSSSAIATHSELLEAERDLIASHIRCATVAMTKVYSLTKDEAYIGQCWKKFAISLSNLFSVEKDLETAHIGDQIKSSKKNQPFRKLRKSAVDDGLRVLAKAKIDRARPSLATLRSMMNAYYADLNSVVPAFKEYRDAISQLQEISEISSLSTSRRDVQNDWTSSFKAITSNITKHIIGTEERTLDTDTVTLEGGYSLSTTQSKALQTRVMMHERMLKYYITSLCRGCPLRTARMAWWYLKLEMKQASNANAAATALRQTLSIDADTALSMKERRYEEDELKANNAEIELVKRILDLGSDQGDSVHHTESKIKRENALRLTMQRVGRWDAETALAVLEAAGVRDAEVQMDETSRELRHVRKFAISLRENVVRCRETAEALAACFVKSGDNAVLISRSRRNFWAAISTVFSSKLLSDQDRDGISSPSTRVLSAVGISISDKGGWLGHVDESKNQQRRRCGEVAKQYLKKRDHQANIMISRVLKLLSEYEQRLEGIESFVYMHCVGIQLERHCSKRRAKALSAWEKRTDISTAINVATKKRIPKLVQELKVKLDALPQVSHTTVIKAKESHLASKTLKSELHKLANKRLGRAQEVSTERVIAIMSLWAKHEESVAIEEIRALGEAVQEVELSVEGSDIDTVADRGVSPDARSLQNRNEMAAEVRTKEGRNVLI